MGALAFVKQMADAQLARMGGSREDGQVEYSDEEEALFARANNRITMFDFGGPLSFGAAADLGHQVRENSRGRGQVLILDFSSVPFIDVSAARAVETIGCDADSSGKKVFISGMNDSVRAVLTGLSADCCLADDNYYSKRIDAIKAAVAYIEDSPNEGGSRQREASAQPT
jgi:SulP family sulfate permease